MDPKVKKVIDAAMTWTDNPSMRNAGKLKSAVAGYRQALLVKAAKLVTKEAVIVKEAPKVKVVRKEAPAFAISPAKEGEE